MPSLRKKLHRKKIFTKIHFEKRYYKSNDGRVIEKTFTFDYYLKLIV